MCGKGKFNYYVITKSSKFGHPHPPLVRACSIFVTPYLHQTFRT